MEKARAVGAEIATVAVMTIAVTEVAVAINLRKVAKTSVLTKKSLPQGSQKPRNTSSEKKTGFVIRNKGDK